MYSKYGDVATICFEPADNRNPDIGVTAPGLTLHPPPRGRNQEKEANWKDSGEVELW